MQNFKNSDFDLKEMPLEFNKDRLKDPLKDDDHQASQELTWKISCCHVILLNQLKSMGSMDSSRVQ